MEHQTYRAASRCPEADRVPKIPKFGYYIGHDTADRPVHVRCATQAARAIAPVGCGSCSVGVVVLKLKPPTWVDLSTGGWGAGRRDWSPPSYLAS